MTESEGPSPPRQAVPLGMADPQGPTLERPVVAGLPAAQTGERYRDDVPPATPHIVEVRSVPRVAETLDSQATRGPLPPATVSIDEIGLSGHRLGRYVILSMIGEGGMGEVYSAYDEELDRRVAIKVLRSRFTGDPHRGARMQREAQALARISHPNVVQIHDVGELAFGLFVAMEFVRGETLRDWTGRLDPASPVDRRAIIDMYIQAGHGLAAAHARDLVHRDFKPENVLVGDDGRARVLDFGLATQRACGAEPVAQDGEPSPRGLLDGDLTRTGAIMGTPAYMAPEQFLALPADQRSDVFSFSAALYEALYGELPFGGDTFYEREAAVVGGHLCDAPTSAQVPLWIRAVLVRGLARDPGDRPPSLEVLIAALQDDPIARRRRRLTVLGAVIAVIGVTVLLVIGGLWGWERWQSARAEAQAAERHAAVEDRIDELTAAGSIDEAERIFATFIAHPDNRGTAALGAAWLRRARRAQARDLLAPAVDAFATAYAVASADDDQISALHGLGMIFSEEERWPALLLMLDTLIATHPDAEERPDLLDLRLDAALARRDFEGAVTLLRGPLAGSPRAPALAVIERLAHATATPHHHRGSAQIADLDGDGDVEIILDPGPEGRVAPVLRSAPTLPLMMTLEGLRRSTLQTLDPGAGESALVVVSERGAVLMDQGVVSLRRLEGGKLKKLDGWIDQPAISALSADLDGDGERELLVGTGPYTRHVIALSEAADGDWSTRAPAQWIDRRGSDVVELLADDLDGDGRVELVAVLGPWFAYEVAILRHDPGRGELAFVTRHRLGNARGAALVRRGLDGDGGHPEIVVSKTDEYRKPEVFPSDRPVGEDAGVYFLSLDDDRLVERAYVPAPSLGPDAMVIHKRPIVGDLDGDGRDEVIVNRSLADSRGAVERESAIILVSARDGTIIPLALGQLSAIAAIDLDDDGDDELIVAEASSTSAGRVWVLGAGVDTLPRLQARRPPAAAGVESGDPTLIRMWRQADDLVRMGLSRQAAESLETLAALAGEPSLRAQAQRRAAELYESLGLDDEAARLFIQAAVVDAQRPEALESAARSFLRLGSLEEAAAAIEATGVDGTSGPRSAVASLRGGPKVELDLSAPLSTIWRIGQPLAIARDAMSESLHIEAISPGELLSAPIEWSGGSISLEIEIELDDVEWDGGLEFGITADGGDIGSGPLGITITGGGGGHHHFHELRCVSSGEFIATDIPLDRTSRLGGLRIRATLLPELGEWICEIERSSGECLGYARRPHGDPQPGVYRLAAISTRNEKARISGELQRLSLRGAGFGAVGDDEIGVHGEFRRRIVEGELVEATGDLAPGDGAAPEDRLLEVVALARLARSAEAEAKLDQILTETGAAQALTGAFKVLLRADPERFAPILRGALGPARYRELLVEAWLLRLTAEVQDPRVVAVLWAGLADMDVDDPSLSLDLVEARGIVAARLGYIKRAQASYRAGLALLADSTRWDWVSPSELESVRASYSFELAALAIRDGDLPGARQIIAPFIEISDDLTTRDRLRARDDLKELWDLIP